MKVELPSITGGQKNHAGWTRKWRMLMPLEGLGLEAVILKLQQASESPRGYVKTQVTQSHAQNF